MTRPELDQVAYHGRVGEFALAAAPYTEADPAAVLASTLAAFGAACGRGPHVIAGNDRHAAALFVVVVGATSRAKKGTSWAVARSVIERACPAMAERTLGGFGSGEALVDAVSDPDEDATRRDDRRLLVHEPELARMLKVIGRDGSTLGTVVRQAWDGARLAIRTRGAGNVTATDYHVGVVAHITREELARTLTETETYGGTANRFLFIHAERSQLLPDGGNVPDELLDAHGRALAEAWLAALRRGRMERSTAAARAWRDLYGRLAEDEPDGLLGAVTARAAAQCLRLSLAYALADTAERIEPEHIAAAEALWTYSRATAEAVFGTRTGNTIADQLLEALQRAGDTGLDATEQRRVFANHIQAATLARARAELEQRGLVATEEIPTGGRPRIVTRAVAHKAHQRRKANP